MTDDVNRTLWHGRISYLIFLMCLGSDMNWCKGQTCLRRNECFSLKWLLKGSQSSRNPFPPPASSYRPHRQVWLLWFRRSGPSYKRSEPSAWRWSAVVGCCPCPVSQSHMSPLPAGLETTLHHRTARSKRWNHKQGKIDRSVSSAEQVVTYLDVTSL